MRGSDRTLVVDFGRDCFSGFPVYQRRDTPLIRLREIRMTSAATLLVACAVLMAAPAAAAQAVDPSPPSGAAAASADDPTRQTFTAGWDHGISVESADHAYKVQFGALIQGDGRFAPGDPAVVDTFLVRRARPILQGRVARAFEFRLMPDFASGTATLFDAYIDTVFSNAWRERVGKSK